MQNFSSAKHGRRRVTTHTFSFSKDEHINWVVAGKEFIREGKLYDVVAVINTRDGVEVQCFPDPKEDKIVADFRHYLSGKPPLDTVHAKVKKYFALKYLKTETPGISYTCSVLKQAVFPAVPVRCSYSIDVIPPPPKSI